MERGDKCFLSDVLVLKIDLNSFEEYCDYCV